MPQSQSQSQSQTDAPDLAVLTGDIIRSSKLAPEALDAAMEALARGAAAMSGWEGARDAALVRFRGDGWQCLAPAPAMALRAALFLRAHLRAIDRDTDTRVSVGIGPGTLPASGGLAAAGGPAFEVSGRGLDKMPTAQRIAASWSRPPLAASAIAAIFALSDEISRLWTPRQAEVMIETLAPGAKIQEVLAAQRGITQQAIAKRLTGSGYWALRRALAALETDLFLHSTAALGREFCDAT
jgi:hypothetical protein